MDDLMISPEAAFKRLGIGRTLGYQLIKEGRLPSVKIGRLRRIPVHALEAWVRSLERETA